MQLTSTQKFIRTSPRKLRLVVDSIKHLSPENALTQLKFLPHSAALLISKVIKSALANATHNHQLDRTKLIFKSIQVSQGPTLKRGQPVSRGQHHAIKKRTSHIKVTLESKDSISKQS